MTDRLRFVLAPEAVEISVSTAARIAGCSPDTVLRWIEEGVISARRISARGWWKIKKESLERYLKRCSGETELENTANTARSPGAANRFVARKFLA